MPAVCPSKRSSLTHPTVCVHRCQRMDVFGTVDTAVVLDPPRAGVRMVEPTNTATRASRSAWSREQRMRFQKNKKKGKIVVRFWYRLHV